MNFEIGDTVIYTFPDPVSPKTSKFIGKIEEISGSYIFIKNEKNIRLKVSAKNFELINFVNTVIE